MKYFSINELTKSDYARSHSIDNTPTHEIATRLQRLIDDVLDPLREAYGRAIVVTSGYRCGRLNRAVGGVSTSQHSRGEAVDIVGANAKDNYKLASIIFNNGNYDQLILEHYDNKTRSCKWVHVSYRAVDNRHEVLLYYGGVYRYINGCRLFGNDSNDNNQG